MNPPQLEVVKRIFSATLALPQQTRSQFAQSACGSDAVLLAAVEKLLATHNAAQSFLETSAPELLGATSPNLDPEPSLLGERINDRYLIERLLARSGFATAYYARDEGFGGRAVVIKVLDRHGDTDTVRRSLKSEVTSLGKLQHPSLVSAFETGELPTGTPYLVLNYVPGLTLRELMAEQPTGTLPPTRILPILKEVAKAVGTAHRHGIAHLDLKPENIIISDPGTSDERATVIDFGIAQLFGDAASEQEGIAGAGSLRYMAPEQRTTPGPHCDVYSIGVIAVEALTGRLPEKPSPNTDLIPEFRGREAVIRALHEDPSARYPSAGELANALEKALAPPPAEPTQPNAPSKRTFLGIAAAVLLGVIAGGWYLSQRDQPKAAYAQPSPFITSLGRERRPTLSPDGKWLYFVVGVDGRLDIFKKSTEGGEPVPVVVNDQNDDYPHVSPDGKRLGFLRNRGNARVLIVKELDEGGRETVFGPERNLQDWSWAPDGKYIVSTARVEERGIEGLFRLDLSSGEWSTFWLPESGKQRFYNPSISPDGERLAFVQRWDASTASDVFFFELDANCRAKGAPQQLTNTRTRIDFLDWTPDSRDLLFVNGPLGHGSLWRVPVRAGLPTPRPIEVAGNRIENITVARRSWKFAYSVDLSDANLWRLDLKSGRTASVFSSTYEDEEGRLSPDGRKIAFASARSGQGQIWVAESDGSNPRQITNLPGVDDARAIWTGDSQTLIVSLMTNATGQQIYLTQPGAAQPKLDLWLQDAMASSLSADGKRLYFERTVNGKRNLWVTDFPGNRQVKQANFDLAHVGIESPDGKFLFYARRHEDDGVYRQELPGNGPGTRFVERLQRRNLFAVGKAGVYFVATLRGESTPSLLYRPLNGGSATRLHRFDRSLGWGLDLAPDEKSVLYTKMDSGNADIMLVGWFR